MSKKRRQFDRVFKVEAVRLITEEIRPDLMHHSDRGGQYATISGFKILQVFTK